MNSLITIFPCQLANSGGLDRMNKNSRGASVPKLYGKFAMFEILTSILVPYSLLNIKHGDKVRDTK